MNKNLYIFFSSVISYDDELLQLALISKFSLVNSSTFDADSMWGS